MNNRQFGFSVSVGISLAVLGSIIALKATVGLSLIALGASIATLALFTRFKPGTLIQNATVPARRLEMTSPARPTMATPEQV